MRHFIYILALLMLSCSVLPVERSADSISRKELRQQARKHKRAARLIERAKRIDPSIARTRTDLVPVQLIAPAAVGSIQASPQLPAYQPIDGRIVITRAVTIQEENEISPAYIGPKTFFFEDEFIQASLSFELFVEMINTPPPRLDYETKPREVTGEVQMEYDYITPTEPLYMPRTWWENALMIWGVISLILWMVVAGIMVYLITKKRA